MEQWLVWLFGDAEAADQAVNLKWLASGEQQAIAQADLLKMADELKIKIAGLKQ